MYVMATAVHHACDEDADKQHDKVSGGAELLLGRQKDSSAAACLH